MVALLAALLLSSAPITVVNKVKQITDAIHSHHGKVVVVKFWATWCGPCIEEFPEFLETMKELPPDDIAVVSISADDKDQIVRYVQPFLDKNAMPYPTLLIDGIDPKFLTPVIDKTWNASLPATFVYDRRGVMQKRLQGKTKDLAKTVKKLIAEPAPTE